MASVGGSGSCSRETILLHVYNRELTENSLGSLVTREAGLEVVSVDIDSALDVHQFLSNLRILQLDQTGLLPPQVLVEVRFIFGGAQVLLLAFLVRAVVPYTDP